MSQGLSTFGCRGNTIKVASGGYVDLLRPDPATIDLQSIAAGLSKICRYGGQCPVFYSVAEHSVQCMRLASKAGYRGAALAAVLLHDAAEAYCGDMVKPLKNAIPEYGVIEERLEGAIDIALNLHFGEWHDVIKRFDRILLKAEKKFLWPNDEHAWQGLDEVEDAEIDFEAWLPVVAEKKFLEAANLVCL